MTAGCLEVLLHADPVALEVFPEVAVGHVQVVMQARARTEPAGRQVPEPGRRRMRLPVDDRGSQPFDEGRAAVSQSLQRELPRSLPSRASRCYDASDSPMPGWRNWQTHGT